ncbi:TlpA disulfide reductase family protein [Mucilaginibacter sp.]|uniref:TlpA family protein disulfide reductase n=1 Tax=Mucilaginibacter sp. TaxID=1882438 RepID=UPI00326327E3
MYKLLTVLIICFTLPCMAQSELPSVKIKALSGKEVAFNTLLAQGDTATIVSFWATWCLPCITELETINDDLPGLKKATPFKFLAISVDDARTTAKVRSFAAGKGWDFDFYTDANGDLKRALNINDIPYVMIIKKGIIVYQHTGYVPGNEEELYDKLKSL